MKVDTGPVFQAFDSALALVSDPEQRALAERILHASRDSVQRAIHDMLRAVVEEVNQASAGGISAELVYRPEGLELIVSTPSPEEQAESDAEIELAFDTGEIERLTLRLPSELKELAALAADQSGVSLNAWLTRLVTREAGRRQGREAYRGRRGRRGPGQSLKGWIGG
jgi:hypothetical protein